MIMSYSGIHWLPDGSPKRQRWVRYSELERCLRMAYRAPRFFSGCCGYSYSCHNAYFNAPNFSVSMTDETYDYGYGEQRYEFNDVMHPGRSPYYYYDYDGYIYSYAFSGSRCPGGSVPGGAGGPTGNGVGTSSITAGEPGFGNYASVDMDALLDEQNPKPPEPNVPTPSPASGSNGGDSVVWAFTKGFFGQGPLNIINGLQDLAIDTVNLGLFGGYNLTSWGMNNLLGTENPYVGIPSPDWSKSLVTEESDAAHGWSKASGAGGIAAVMAAKSLAGTALGGSTMAELPGVVWNGIKKGASNVKDTVTGWFKGKPKTPAPESPTLANPGTRVSLHKLLLEEGYVKFKTTPGG